MELIKFPVPFQVVDSFNLYRASVEQYKQFRKNYLSDEEPENPFIIFHHNSVEQGLWFIARLTPQVKADEVLVTQTVEAFYELVWNARRVDLRETDGGALRQALLNKGVCIRVNGVEVSIQNSDGTEVVLDKHNEEPKYTVTTRQYTDTEHGGVSSTQQTHGHDFTVTQAIDRLHERLCILYKVDTRVLDNDKLRRDLLNTGICVRIRGDEIYVRHCDGTEVVLPRLTADEWRDRLVHINGMRVEVELDNQS